MCRVLSLHLPLIARVIRNHWSKRLRRMKFRIYLILITAIWFCRNRTVKVSEFGAILVRHFPRDVSRLKTRLSMLRNFWRAWLARASQESLTILRYATALPVIFART